MADGGGEGLGGGLHTVYIESEVGTIVGGSHVVPGVHCQRGVEIVGGRGDRGRRIDEEAHGAGAAALDEAVAVGGCSVAGALFDDDLVGGRCGAGGTHPCLQRDLRRAEHRLISDLGIVLHAVKAVGLTHLPCRESHAIHEGGVVASDELGTAVFTGPPGGGAGKSRRPDAPGVGRSPARGRQTLRVSSVLSGSWQRGGSHGDDGIGQRKGVALGGGAALAVRAGDGESVAARSGGGTRCTADDTGTAHGHAGGQCTRAESIGVTARAARGGEAERIVGHILGGHRHGAGADADDGAGAEAEVNGVLRVGVAAASRFSAGGQGDDRTDHGRADASALDAIAVVVLAVVIGVHDAGGKWPGRGRCGDVNAVGAGLIDGEAVNTRAVCRRAGDHRVGGAAEQLHRHTCTHARLRGAAEDAVVVGVNKELVAQLDAGEEAEVDGEVGVRVGVSVVHGLGAAGHGDDRAVNVGARAAGLAAFVFIIDAVVRGDHVAAGGGRAGGRSDAHDILAGGECVEVVSTSGVGGGGGHPEIVGVSGDVVGGGVEIHRDAADAHLGAGADITQAVFVGVVVNEVADGERGGGADLAEIDKVSRHRIGAAAAGESDAEGVDLRSAGGVGHTEMIGELTPLRQRGVGRGLRPAAVIRRAKGRIGSGAAAVAAALAHASSGGVHLCLRDRVVLIEAGSGAGDDLDDLRARTQIPENGGRAGGGIGRPDADFIFLARLQHAAPAAATRSLQGDGGISALHEHQALAMAALDALHPGKHGACGGHIHLCARDRFAKAAGAVRAANPLEGIDAGAEIGARAIVAQHLDARACDVRQPLEFKARVVDKVRDLAGVGVGKADVHRAVGVGVVAIHRHAGLHAGSERDERSDDWISRGGLNAVVVVVHPVVQVHLAGAHLRVEGRRCGNTRVVHAGCQAAEEVQAVGVRGGGRDEHVITTAVFQHSIHARSPELDGQAGHAALGGVEETVVVHVHPHLVAEAHAFDGEGEGAGAALAVVGVGGTDRHGVAAQRGGRAADGAVCAEHQSGRHGAADERIGIRRAAATGGQGGGVARLQVGVGRGAAAQRDGRADRAHRVGGGAGAAVGICACDDKRGRRAARGGAAENTTAAVDAEPGGQAAGAPSNGRGAGAGDADGLGVEEADGRCRQRNRTQRDDRAYTQRSGDGGAAAQAVCGRDHHVVCPGAGGRAAEDTRAGKAQTRRQSGGLHRPYIGAGATAGGERLIVGAARDDGGQRGRRDGDGRAVAQADVDGVLHVRGTAGAGLSAVSQREGHAVHDVTSAAGLAHGVVVIVHAIVQGDTVQRHELGGPRCDRDIINTGLEDREAVDAAGIGGRGGDDYVI